ncbi:MAG: hypothetical protein R6V35_05110 [Candidatus Nanohaloarchaea archaeon]
MIDFLKKIFGEEEKEFSTEWREAPELLRDLKSEEIERAEEEVGDLMSKSSELLDELEDSLEEVKDYEDRQGIEAVEDVANNFYNSRRKLIEDLELSDRPIQHKKDLKEFIEEFEDVSRKEEAVMKRVKNEANSLFRAIKDIHEHLEEFNEFLEENYSTVTSIEDMESQVEEIEGVLDRKEQLVEEKSDIGIEEIKNEISGLESQIEQLKESEEWKKKEKIEKKLEDLRDEKNSIESELDRQLSRIERPMKKLVYNIESGDVDFEGSVDQLRRMRDQEFEKLGSIDLSEAYDLSKKADFIEDNQVKKLEEVSNALENFSDRKDKIAELEERIEKKEGELDDLEVDEERRKLVNKLSSKEEELREKKIDRENLQEEISGLKEKESKLIKDLENDANELTRHEIEIKKE